MAGVTEKRFQTFDANITQALQKPEQSRIGQLTEVRTTMNQQQEALGEPKTMIASLATSQSTVEQKTQYLENQRGAMANQLDEEFDKQKEK